MIPNVDKGLVALGLVAGEGLEPTAFWPEGDSATPGLLDTARLAMTRRASVVSDHALTDTDSTASNLIVAYPLFRDDQPFGVVAVQRHGGRTPGHYCRSRYPQHPGLQRRGNHGDRRRSLGGG